MLTVFLDVPVVTNYREPTGITSDGTVIGNREAPWPGWTRPLVARCA